jgi:hypothetical protein
MRAYQLLMRRFYFDLSRLCSLPSLDLRAESLSLATVAKSQIGATVVHWALLWLFPDRGVGVDRTCRGVLERGPETISTVAI